MKDTVDFKDIMNYGYANHREEKLTDKITNINPSIAGSKKEHDSVVDLTNIDEMELYVDRSIREGYTGRAVSKRYHNYYMTHGGQRDVSIENQPLSNNYVTQNPHFNREKEQMYDTINTTPERII